MQQTVSNTAMQVKTPTCPHGFPVGSCPICNGSGGSVRRPGEWSREKCIAVGNQMRYAAMMRKMDKDFQEQSQVNAENLKTFIQNIKTNYKIFMQNLMSSLPTPVATVVKIAAAVLISPVLFVLNNVVRFASMLAKGAEFVKEKLIFVAEKLAAVFGDLKNFIKSKFEKDFKKVAKNISKFFTALFGREDDENEGREALSAHLAKGN